MSNLVLIPTPSELAVVRRALASNEQFDPQAWALQICGFGPIAAAARTSALISRYHPERVMLVGIAGTFDEQVAPIGTACRFDSVVCDGIGIGSGSHHQSAADAGWPQFAGGDAAPQIDDVIALPSFSVNGLAATGTLLTCCSATANRDEAQRRRTDYPDATAEDMEGFGVALACMLAGVPVQIVRGISNRVGDRDQTNWQTQRALQSAVDLAVQLMPRTWMPTQI